MNNFTHDFSPWLTYKFPSNVTFDRTLGYPRKAEELRLSALGFIDRKSKFIIFSHHNIELTYKLMMLHEAATEFVRDIPYYWFTKRAITSIIKNNFRKFKHIPDDLKTPEFFAKLIRKAPGSIIFVPKHMLASDIIQEAIKHDWSMIKYAKRYAKKLP